MALTPAESNSEERILFILAYYPNNLSAKNIILRNFKIVQSDPEAASIFSQPPLDSFKPDKPDKSIESSCQKCFAAY